MFPNVTIRRRSRTMLNMIREIIEVSDSLSDAQKVQAVLRLLPLVGITWSMQSRTKTTLGFSLTWLTKSSLRMTNWNMRNQKVIQCLTERNDSSSSKSKSKKGKGFQKGWNGIPRAQKERSPLRKRRNMLESTIFRRSSAMLVQISATMSRTALRKRATDHMNIVGTSWTFVGYQQKADGFTLETIRESRSKRLVPAKYIRKEAQLWF